MKRFRILNCIISSLCTLAVFIAVTYAWFITGEFVKPEVSGYSVSAYFAGGDGTLDDPFILSSPRHVYNLAWLQYIGTFNKTTAGSTTDLEKQYHFALSNSIDMEGYTLPPIGTEDYPFVGVFEGNNNAIVNLTVSSDTQQITQKPSEITLKEEAIVGLFGVVGNYNGKYTTLGSNAISSGVMTVQNLILDDIIINVTKTNSLCGIIAGYVDRNAKVDTVGVYYSSFKIKQGLTFISSFDKISKYSLIGDLYNTTIGDTTVGVEWNDKPGSGSGTDLGFGGSMDMLTFAKRLTYLLSSSAKSSYTDSSTIKAFSNTYNIALQSTYTSPYSFRYDNPSSAVCRLYSENGYKTYLPFSVNTDNILNDEYKQDFKASTVSSYQTQKNYPFNSNYQENGTETITSKNNGYFVGGISTSYCLTARVQKLYETDSKSNPFYGSLKSTSGALNANYTGDNLEIRTIKNNGNEQGTEYTIIDDYNKNNSVVTSNSTYSAYRYDSQTLNLTRYKDVRDQFEEMLQASNGNIEGLRFSNGQFDELKTDSQYSFNATVNLFGEEISGYQLCYNTIDFSIRGDGYIAMLAAGYSNAYSTSSSSAYDLFDIYVVTRDSNHQIKSKTRIDKIAYDSSGKYILNGGQTSEFVYTTGCTRDRLQPHVLYYFEIPVSTDIGTEYVLCPRSGKTGAYLLYLDVGANASEAATSYNGSIGNIDFITATEEAGVYSYTQVSKENCSSVVFEINGTSTNENQIHFLRSDKVYYYNSVTGIVVTPIEGSSSIGSSSDEDKSKKNES